MMSFFVFRCLLCHEFFNNHALMCVCQSNSTETLLFFIFFVPPSTSCSEKQKKLKTMNEMYCAEQIAIPSELGTVLKLMTKASIRDKPTDVYKWAANYFASQCNRPNVFDESGKLTAAGRESMPNSQPYVSGTRNKPSPGSKAAMAAAGSPDKQQQQQGPAGGESPDQEAENQIVDALFDRYDPERSNLIQHKVLPSLIMDLKAELGLDFTHDQMEDFVNSMQPDDNGFVDLDEFRVSFFQG